jgi:hypothetical protein
MIATEEKRRRDRTQSGIIAFIPALVASHLMFIEVGLLGCHTQETTEFLDPLLQIHVVLVGVLWINATLI